MTESAKVNLTEVKEAVASLGEAYKEPSVKVLDPDAISGSLLERMPNPTGWRILVLPYRGKGKTEGGIFLPDSAVEQQKISTQVGYVLKVGPLAYQDENKFGNEAWAKKGDWILIGRYAGTRFKLEDDHEVRIINDDEVIATILNPDDIKSL